MERQGQDEARSLQNIKLRNDLAAIRFQTALVRWELKYRADQPRKPKGPGGGQFTRDGGGPVEMAKDLIARAGLNVLHRAVDGVSAISDLQNRTIAGETTMLSDITSPGALSMVPGIAARDANGAVVLTPFGLPLPSLSPGQPTMFRDTGAGKEPVPKGQFDDECEEQLRKDELDCDLQAAMYGGTKKRKNQILGACYEQAFQRYSECLLGGVDAIRSPRFDGRQSFPKRRN